MENIRQTLFGLNKSESVSFRSRGKLVSKEAKKLLGVDPLFCLSLHSYEREKRERETDRE